MTRLPALGVALLLTLVAALENIVQAHDMQPIGACEAISLMIG